MFEEKITCPYCEESIILRKEKHLLKAGQPAEYQEKLVINKDAQKTIEQSAGPKLDTKSKGKGDDV